MRIFLDTANIEDIRHAAGLGVISGVTTNPTLVSREGAGDLKAAILEICSIVPGPISVEALSLDANSIKQEARELASWHKNVVVKIPISEAGLEAISVLSRENIKTNLTLCFSANQALLGALAGATYVSPFVGRLDDIGHHGMSVVADTVEIYSHYEIPTQVIAASLRHPLHTIEAAKAGAHIATVPYSMLMQMIRHPLTDIGIARFAEDWNKVAKQ
ncbi:MAG: fructose-6-phosphate aldolase [Dehalococcoidia bacterium]|jgi:transaldolase|nr:fructose-6-phosphate aldolase [Dehalococcoidia bacterium]